MSLNTQPNTPVAVLDGANPNTLADTFRLLKLGTQMRQAMPVTLRRVNPASAAAEAHAYQLSTLAVIALPDDCKAHTILRATGLTTGNAGTGELTVEPYGTTPATTQIAVAPNGDIVFLEADEITSVDITYIPEKMDVVEFTAVPVAGVVTLPTSLKAVLLMEAEILAGTHTGKNIIVVPGAAPGTTLQANLSVSKLLVQFDNGADAPTSVRIKLGIVSAVDFNAAMETTTPLI